MEETLHRSKPVIFTTIMGSLTALVIAILPFVFDNDPPKVDAVPEAPPPRVVADAEETVRISGSVVIEDGAVPIGAEIYLIANPLQKSPDDEGNFVFDVPKGVYLILVRRPDETRSSRTATVYAESSKTTQRPSGTWVEYSVSEIANEAEPGSAKEKES